MPGIHSISPLDLFLIVIILLSALRAMMHGLVRELFWLAGSILGLIFACNYYPRAAILLHTIISNPAVAAAVGFILIVLATTTLAGILGWSLSRTVRFAGLGWADSIAGGIFGLVRGILLVTAGMMAVAAFLPRDSLIEHQITGSTFAPYFLQAAHGVSSLVPAELQQRITSGATLLGQ